VEPVFFFRGDLKDIADVAGPEAAIAIARAFGGQTLYIPTFEAFERARRDARIRAEYDAGGVSVRDLSRRYKLCTRRVTRILNR